jgi:hypothetical protein
MTTKTVAEAKGRRVAHPPETLKKLNVTSSLHPSWLDEEYLEAQTRAFRSKKPSLSYEDYLAQKAANGMPVREASDSKPE